MRVAIIKTDQKEKETAICMKPYNNEKEIAECYEYMNQQQALDLANGNLSSYGKRDIGFDIIFANDDATIMDFLDQNPEYAKYNKVDLEGSGQTVGLCVYKDWKSVENARKLGILKKDAYEQVKADDRKKLQIKIEGLPCERNQHMLHKIALNIAEEVKAAPEIVECLRSGENRSKENEITYKNWIDEEGKEFNCVTYRNGGQAFSILLDSDMNILTSKYNDHFFQNPKEWIPYEDAAEKKDCLMMIYNKMPDMKFNEWLADMGENEKYKQIKEEIVNHMPAIGVSEYYPLQELGTGYFILTYKQLQMAVQIRNKQLESYNFRTLNEEGHASSKWSEDHADPNSLLYCAYLQLKNTGHIVNDGKKMSDCKFAIANTMLSSIHENYNAYAENKTVDSPAITQQLDELIVRLNEMKTMLSLQETIHFPIEIEEEEEVTNEEEIGEEK